MRADDEARVALVTGAGRGIGRAIAVALGERGWRVAVNYRADEEAAAEAARLVEQAGGEALTLRADVAGAADRERLVGEALGALGRIDMLVNNAGAAPARRLDLLETSEESFDRIVAVNLKGAFFLTQRVARAMIGLIESGAIERADIVNVGSVSAYAASPDRPEYCISKAGLAMVTRLFAARLAGHGINVYEVRPGLIRTDMTAPVAERYEALIAGGLTPIPRWGEPREVALAVAAIAEGRLPFSTGEVIDVDGGFHLCRL